MLFRSGLPQARCFGAPSGDDARRMKLAAALLVTAFALLPVVGQDPAAPATPPADPTQTVVIDASLLAGLKARSIGPATTSGRIGAVCGVPGDAKVVWVGAASGGVWKSTDGGVRFTPVFDDQDCTSIGAIAKIGRAHV